MGLGLKILGSGEWNVHRYKASRKRRGWRKLHIGVDDEGFIVAAELTASSEGDASTLPDLLAQVEVPIQRFTADGAYDHRSIYNRVAAAGTEDIMIVIPPRRSAVCAGPTDGPWAQREAALQRIREVGRREWQKESGYRQQARVGVPGSADDVATRLPQPPRLPARRPSAPPSWRDRSSPSALTARIRTAPWRPSAARWRRRDRLRSCPRQT